MTAKTLWDKFIVHYGLPKKILVDQGGCWPLWADGDTEDKDQSISSTNQQPMWEIQLHSDQHAWHITQGEEIRVEEPHWNIGSCIQLHLKFSYRVQPLLPHVWETTLPSSRCHTWFGSMYHHGAKHFQICPENVEMCQVGSKESWVLSSKGDTNAQT